MKKWRRLTCVCFKLYPYKIKPLGENSDEIVKHKNTIDVSLNHTIVYPICKIWEYKRSEPLPPYLSRRIDREKV